MKVVRDRVGNGPARRVAVIGGERATSSFQGLQYVMAPTCWGRPFATPPPSTSRSLYPVPWLHPKPSAGFLGTPSLSVRTHLPVLPARHLQPALNHHVPARLLTRSTKRPAREARGSMPLTAPSFRLAMPKPSSKVRTPHAGSRSRRYMVLQIIALPFVAMGS